jgi:hypothetical protein
MAPILRDCMLKTRRKRIHTLKLGVPARLTTTWEAMCSLVRCKEAFALLMLTQKSAVNDVVRSKGQGTKAFRDSFGYLKVETFCSDVIVFFDLLISTVEYSLILQGV